MSYTPTTWATGDTITAAALNKMEQGIASAGGGYDFVITGEWDENQFDWQALTLESGSYSDIVAMLQNGTVPSGICYITRGSAVRIGFLCSIADESADDFVAIAFIMFSPIDDSIGVIAFLINSDNSVDPD